MDTTPPTGEHQDHASTMECSSVSSSQAPHKFLDSVIVAMPPEIRAILLTKASIQTMPKSLDAMALALHEAFK